MEVGIIPTYSNLLKQWRSAQSWHFGVALGSLHSLSLRKCHWDALLSQVLPEGGYTPAPSFKASADKNQHKRINQNIKAWTNPTICTDTSKHSYVYVYIYIIAYIYMHILPVDVYLFSPPARWGLLDFMLVACPPRPPPLPPPPPSPGLLHDHPRL